MKLKLGDFLIRRKDAVDVTDGVKYKRATIRINHKGISIRDEKDGAQIKTKRQFAISKGQFLLSKIDARNGAFGIVPNELDKGIITGNFWTFDVDQSKVLIDFFKAFTESVSFTDMCIRSSSGTTNRKYLDEKKFLEIDIEVPDIEQQTVVISNYYQKREVTKNLKDFGVNQREILTNLRQSILQEAVQGKLTAKWRANNPNIAPASELLNRIRAEKQQLIAEKKIRKEKPLSPVEDEEIPFDVPKKWMWCRLGETASSYKRDIIDGPFGSNLKATEYVESGVPVIRLQNISRNKFLYKSIKYITEEKAEFLKRHNYNHGDVVICKLGDPTGKACIIPEGMQPGRIVADIVRYRVNDSILFNQYLCFALNAPISINQFNSEATGMTRQRVNLSKIRELLFALPPLEEQIAIVNKVNSLMALCDELDQQIETSQTQIKQLMQSCLKEVFEHESN